MKQGKLYANGQEQLMPETLAAAVYMDETKTRTVAEELAGGGELAVNAHNADAGAHSSLFALKANASAVEAALDNKADLVDGKIPGAQLPSYVDDVLEYENLSALPVVGESGKIYITIDTNKSYRYTGTGYGEISESLALGETSASAYRGDRGKAAYDHSQATGNPHGITGEMLISLIMPLAAGNLAKAKTITSGSVNDVLESGIYLINYVVSGKPADNAGVLLVGLSSVNYALQVFFPLDNAMVIYARVRQGSPTWNPWYKLPAMTLA
jgi:hypothetical protein